jgi:hypothetical protein
MMWNATQIALIREAAISGNALSIGLSAMRKANFAKLGLYGESFFNVSIGLERLLKIICLMDFLISSNKFPTDKELKAFGQNIEDLFRRVDDIRLRYKVKNSSLVPPGSIEHDLFKFIASFSVSTMYFNLDFFNGGAKAGRSPDPVSEWFDAVAKRIFLAHLSDKQKKKLRSDPKVLDSLVEGFSMVNADNVSPATPADVTAVQASLNPHLQKYATYYCARICRYLYEILLSITREAQDNVAGVEVPNLGGVFFPFETDDAALLARKTFPTRA